jgi:hypothetical protein
MKLENKVKEIGVIIVGIGVIILFFVLLPGGKDLYKRVSANDKLPTRNLVYEYEEHPEHGKMYKITGEYGSSIHGQANYMRIKSVDLDTNTVVIEIYIYDSSTQNYILSASQTLPNYGLYQNQERSYKYIIISPEADILNDVYREEISPWLWFVPILGFIIFIIGGVLFIKKWINDESNDDEGSNDEGNNTFVYSQSTV